MTSLQDQVAVVTGASRGIGKAIALELALHGVKLHLVGRSGDTLDAVAQEARRLVEGVVCHQADLEHDDDVNNLVAALQRDAPRVDILVHAAGVLWWGPMQAATAEQLDSHYRAHLRAPYVITQGLLAQLMARRGQVVFVNSSAALTARANVSQYAATKHAVKAMADSLRDEVNPAGVRVLSLYVGRTASDMQASLHTLEGKAYRPELLIQPQDVAKVALNALTLPRTVEVTDVTLRPLQKYPG
ncbi:MAG TPA: SDR family NAD(P)-dependent oxidoreductase [Ramlibacter sp.]|nr:SDR family NAD(P)-dependent oxidoreductase [Ramlibacter sp.]